MERFAYVDSLVGGGYFLGVPIHGFEFLGVIFIYMYVRYFTPFRFIFPFSIVNGVDALLKSVCRGSFQDNFAEFKNRKDYNREELQLSIVMAAVVFSL